MIRKILEAVAEVENAALDFVPNLIESVALEQTGIGGSGLDADPNSISGFTVLLINARENEGPKNPSALPFAVKDDSGKCAAGIIYGQGVPTTPKPLTLPAGSPCTGNAAHDAAIKAFGFSNPRG